MNAQAPQRRHRWPSPGAPAPGSVRAQEADHRAQELAAIGDLTKAVMSLAPVTLDVSTYVLDGNGQATKSFRVPFAAVAVLSGSLATLTVAAGPPAAAAPGAGPGAGQVSPLGFAAHNIAGRSFTVYGGNPGDLVSVSVFGRPVPPIAESGQVTGTVTAAAFGQASIAQMSVKTSPTAGQSIASIAAASFATPGLYQIDWSVMLAGTLAAADASNMQIILSGTPQLTAMYPEPTAGPVAQPRMWFRQPAGGVIVKVAAIAAGTVGAVYSAQIVATQVSA